MPVIDIDSVSPADILDITTFGEHGAELNQAIHEAVRDTQMWVVHPYPSFLLMTRDQFEELKPDEYATPEDMLFKTALNVMEVRVKGA